MKKKNNRMVRGKDGRPVEIGQVTGDREGCDLEFTLTDVETGLEIDDDEFYEWVSETYPDELYEAWEDHQQFMADALYEDMKDRGNS